MATNAPPPLRVLIVDDDPKAAKALECLLRLEGFEVDACQSVPAALERLHGAPYDAIVTDLETPGLDGPSLRREAGGAGAPALFAVSAYAGWQNAVRLRELDARRHFTKPLAYDALVGELRGVSPARPGGLKKRPLRPRRGREAGAR